MYIHLYTYIHIHKHIYIYTHPFKWIAKSFNLALCQLLVASCCPFVGLTGVVEYTGSSAKPGDATNDNWDGGGLTPGIRRYQEISGDLTWHGAYSSSWRILEVSSEQLNNEAGCKLYMTVTPLHQQIIVQICGVVNLPELEAVGHRPRCSCVPCRSARWKRPQWAMGLLWVSWCGGGGAQIPCNL